MFVVNEDNSIYATRGDIVFLGVTMDDDGVPQEFSAGDVVRIKIYGKKAAENVVLQKDFPIYEHTETAEIYLTSEDTKIGEVISKPTDYWYEVELNPDTNPQTIIGYDEDGAKIFKLFPEGADIESYEPEITPEDIPVVDEVLDLTSVRPVQNMAVAREIIKIKDENRILAEAHENLAQELVDSNNELEQEMANLNSARVEDIAAIHSRMAIQSADYPGCYYRMVGGKVEWINPPMMLDTEYRTSERHNNRPVYVKRFIFPQIPGGEVSVSERVDFPLNAEIISFTGMYKENLNTYALPRFDANGACTMYLMRSSLWNHLFPEEHQTAYLSLETRGFNAPIPYVEGGDHVEATVKYYYTD